MHEPWTYNVCASKEKIFIAAWGGGVIELTKKTNNSEIIPILMVKWKSILFPDDGVIHDITTAVSYANDILWVSSYFGMSRYDGTSGKVILTTIADWPEISSISSKPMAR